MSGPPLSLGHDPRRFRAVLPLVVAAASFALSAALIRRHPAMYWYDPYGRVVARDHILVDRWLPLLQIVIYGVGKLTTGVTALRLVLAAIAGGTIVAASWLGLRLFTYGGGLLFAALLASNSLFVALSVVPYQEVLFLGLVSAGLALHERSDSRRERWLAVLAFNLACLTRYEAWILVAVLAGAELVETSRRNGLWRGAREAVLLAGRYATAAIGWLILVSVLAPSTTLLHQAAPREPIAGFLHQIRWQTGSLLLFPLAGLGLAWTLARSQRRRPHLVLMAFLMADLALVFFANPYSVGNLRATFIPVVLVLLYAAFGLDVVIDQLFRRAHLGRRWWPQLLATSVVAAFIALLFVRDATRFVGAAANEFDFRVPFEVARRLNELPASARARPQIVTLGDNYTDRQVISAYTGIAFDRIAPFGLDLSPNATQVVDIQRPGAVSSGAEWVLKSQLEEGTIPARAVRIESAVIWTLARPGPRHPTGNPVETGTAEDK
jgi:hypothetical protein